MVLSEAKDAPVVDHQLNFAIPGPMWYNARQCSVGVALTNRLHEVFTLPFCSAQRRGLHTSPETNVPCAAIP